jgi:hypothetical protein
VVIPKYHASTAHRTIENIAPESAIILIPSSVPKSTIFITVPVTEAPALPEISTPRKLKIADIKIALPTVKQRVVTQVAMALGASVKPFTKITPRVRAKDVIVSGEKLSICSIELTYPCLFCKIYSTNAFKIQRKIRKVSDLAEIYFKLFNYIEISADPI